jgi:hypothetical protein
MNGQRRSVFIRTLIAGSIVAVFAAAVARAAEGPAKHTSCDSPEDQATLAHLPREAIEDVQPLYEATSSDEFGPVGSKLRGATVTVFPRRGLSRERLQYLVECGVEKASDGIASTDWPQVPAGTMVRVRGRADRFYVDFRAADHGSPEDVLTAVRQYKQ